MLNNVAVAPVQGCYKVTAVSCLLSDVGRPWIINSFLRLSDAAAIYSSSDSHYLLPYGRTCACIAQLPIESTNTRGRHWLLDGRRSLRLETSRLIRAVKRYTPKQLRESGLIKAVRSPAENRLKFCRRTPKVSQRGVLGNPLVNGPLTIAD